MKLQQKWPASHSNLPGRLVQNCGYFAALEVNQGREPAAGTDFSL